VGRNNWIETETSEKNAKSIRPSRKKKKAIWKEKGKRSGDEEEKRKAKEGKTFY